MLPLGVLLPAAGCLGVGDPSACLGTFPADIARVVDGDTLDVDPCGRVRLALIDTPERGEPGSAEATAFTAQACPQRTAASVDVDAGQPRDRYDRLVAVVRCGTTHLNAALLESGHAVVLAEFCGVSEFASEPWAASACGRA